MEPLIFTPCEKVLLDPQQGQSLVNIFHGSKMQVQNTQEIPENAVIPRDWAIFSKWSLTPNEEGIAYTSVIDVYLPDGTLFANSVLEAIQPTLFGMSFVHRMNAFPIGQSGFLRVVHSVRTPDATVYGPAEMNIRIETVQVTAEAMNILPSPHVA